MTSVIRCAAIAALGVVVVAPLSHGAVSVFRDRSAWQTAAGGGPADYLEDFEGFTVDTKFTNPLALTGSTIDEVGANVDNFRNEVDVLPLTFPDNNGTNHASTFVDGDTGLVVQLTPDIAGLAWGADFVLEEPGSLLNEGLDLLVNFVGGGSQLVDLSNGVTNPVVEEFFGIVATGGMQIQSVVLQAKLSDGQAGIGEGFGMDNIAGYNIPTPGVLTAAGLGLGLFAHRRR